MWTKLGKWAKRKPALATLVALSLIVLLGIVGGSLWFADYQRRQAGYAQRREQEAVDAKEIAKNKETEAKAASDQAESFLYDAHIPLASQAWIDGRIERMIQLLDGHRPKTKSEKDRRGWEWYHLHHLPRTVFHEIPGKEKVTGGALPTLHLQMSADGSVLAVPYLSRIELYSMRTRKLIRAVALRSFGGAFALSPDGKQLVTLAGPGQIVFLDLISGLERFLKRERAGRVSFIRFSPNGKAFLIAHHDGSVGGLGQAIRNITNKTAKR